MSPSHVLDELRGIHPAALSVEHQQVDFWHVATEIRRCFTIVGLEHGVPTHPQQCGHRLQEGVVIADNDALGTLGSAWWGGRHCGDLWSGVDCRPWQV
jgi:hypothetical protein